MAVWPLEVSEIETELSQAPLQKHLLGGCIIDILPIKLPLVGDIILLRDTLQESIIAASKTLDHLSLDTVSYLL